METRSIVSLQVCKKRSTQSLKISLFLLEVATSILRVNLSNKVQGKKQFKDKTISFENEHARTKSELRGCEAKKK